MGNILISVLTVVSFVSWRNRSEQDREEARAIVTAIKWKTLGIAFIAIVGVFATFLALNMVAPFLKQNLVGVIRNLFGIESVASKANDFTKALVGVLLASLIPHLPLWTMREEVGFRKGCRTAKDNLKQALKFGPMHIVFGLGVSLSMGIALSVAGLFFGYVYIQAWRKTISDDVALKESAACHLYYNYMAILIAFVTLAV